MKGATETRLPKKALSLLLALALAFCLAVPALAAYPDRPENQYVLDEADVLSEETEQEIIAENQDLFQETGAQIVVVAVDFLDGEDIDDYAYSLFNIWGIGSQERNNGLLLLLAIGEENYYAQAGTGIEDYFDGAKLQDMLDQYLEPDFAAREYDAGVEKFFQAALSDMESYYANYSDEYTDSQDSPTYEEDYDTYYEPSFGERMSYFFGTLFQRVAAAGGDPGNLGGKAVDQLALFLQQAFGDQHGHSHVLVAGCLEPGIHVLLDQLPDGLTIGTQDDEALDTGVLHQLCLDADVGVPLCKVFFLAGDRLHKLLVVFCHFVISS